MEAIQSLANHLLVAMPSLHDPFFSRSVTYVCEHNEQGALGLVLSLPLEATYDELFKHLNIETEDNIDSRVLLAGGPVDRERGFILHSPLGNWESSLAISNDIALSTSEDILKAIAKRQGPEDVVITLGYAGWEEGQLEKEIEENSWLFAPADKDIIFRTRPEERWLKATQLLGIDWTQISEQDGHA
ncbi:YqgE/AlgH family protein [Kangiella sp.]|uniref:YqgE/AlgH family protein n=1 Tax=Kangiella sp. TaxID=1920245 RepID=UPI001986BAC8|nr:YqgE/AlgH family protein [Kangiella sp.]MBD3652665.1 YqgE/AlgH family protein [Kangiella sp.]